ncbi:MAG: shikimate kinase [Dehalococcoidia bacterium]|nr:shikimate kinase [Dehalococcoidia bacterium]
MKTNIALVGFMGTGKTSMGQVLAKKLIWQFVEVDALIEQMAGKSTPDIFAQDGEIAFRELEIEAIKQVARGKKQVIACGGGVVLNTINIARLKKTSVLILLTASPETVLKRTSADRDSRPMLTAASDPATRIRELLKYRRPYYERAADFTINTSKHSLEQITDQIIEKLRNYEGFNFQG